MPIIIPTEKRPFPTKGITHAGVFHADDVFAFAFLSIINENIELLRVNEITDEMRSHEDWVIFDIGGGDFDHHQAMRFRLFASSDADSAPRIGSPLAAFGLVTAGYWNYINMSMTMFNRFDRDLVQLIDQQDATGQIAPNVQNQLSQAIFSFNPNWNEANAPEDYDAAFMLAVKFAKIIIGNYMARIEARLDAEYEVRRLCAEINEEYKTLFLPQYMPYGNTPVNYGARWVAYPSARGGYQIYSLGSTTERNIQKIPDEMIKELKNDPTCIFAHPGGFTAVFDTIENAKVVLKKLALL